MVQKRDESSDTELVAAVLLAKEGPAREDAYRALVLRYWKVVVSLLRTRTHCLRDAEEVAQEAFVKAWSHIDRLEDPRRFLGWLMRIARNAATDRSRVAKRFEHVDDAELGRLAANDSSVWHGAARSELDRVETRDEWERVRGVLDQLPDKYRDVLTLRYLQEMSPQDIARSLGEPEGTIRNRVFRALQRLRTALATL